LSTLQKLSLPTDVAQELSLYVSASITSETPDHRLYLRQALSQILRDDFGLSAEAPLLDLSQRPRVPGYSLSLSHCPGGSALLVGSDKFFVGVDVEVTQRISTAVVGRIAQGREADEAPHPSFVFCSKEAAYKAFNSKDFQPPMPHLETRNWHPVDSTWSSFDVAYSGEILDGQGLACLFGPLSVSICSAPSTFTQKLRQRS
jgi:hypothetical protein